MKRLLAAVAVAIAVFGGPDGPVYTANAGAPRFDAQQEEPGSPRARSALTILQINDVYQTGPVDGFGGLARVATLKQRLKAQGQTPLMLLAGDFLSSSVASTIFKGEQMIAALNAAGLDIATLGNHEFDFGDDLLIERMKEAKFAWVAANVIDARSGEPIGGAAPFVIRTYGSLKVGILGLCLTTAEISGRNLTHTKLLDPILTAGRYIPVMQRQGAQVIIALTHLPIADDRRLAERFPQIDLIVGGHEHYPITVATEHALISKAGADAKYVARIDLLPPRAGAARRYVERYFELIPITDALPDDPATAEVVRSYDARMGPELKVVVGETTVPLDAASVRLRASEMAIGNFITDAMRADTGADVALMNAGSIRGDRVYPAGPITRETLLAIHPFGNIVTVVEAPGRVLLAALNSGVSKYPASAGQFPQVSGLTFTLDANAPPGDRVRDAKVNGAPLDPAKPYTVALPDYVLNGGDNYGMFEGQRVVVGPETGQMLVTILEKYLAAKKTIGPQIENRIVISR